MAKRNIKGLVRTAITSLSSLRDAPRRVASAVDDKVLNAFNVLESKKIFNPRQAKRIRLGIETQQVLNKPWHYNADIASVLDRNIGDISPKRLEEIAQLRSYRIYSPKKGEKVPISERMNRERNNKIRNSYIRSGVITSLRNKKQEGSGIRRKYFSDWVIEDSPNFYDPPNEIEPEIVRSTARGIRNNPSYWSREWVAVPSRPKLSSKPDADRMIRDTEHRMHLSAFRQKALRTPATPLSEKATQSAMKLASKYRTARNIALGAGVGTAAVGTALGLYMARNAQKSKP